MAQIGVIVQVSVEPGLRALTRADTIRSQQAAFAIAQVLEHKFRGAGGRVDVLALAEHLSRDRVTRDHLAVPARENLGIEIRP